MSKEIVDMIKCSYCNTKWIQEEDFICEWCIPGATVDMTLYSLDQAVESLKTVKDINKERFDWLDQAINKLISLREDFRKDDHG